MGDILNRGTIGRPLWYGRFIDIDGKRKQRATEAATKSEARIVVEGWEEARPAGLARLSARRSPSCAGGRA